MVFNTGPYTDLPDNSILITANMQSETGFPSSHQFKSYVAFKYRLKLAARAVLSADAGLLVSSARLLQSRSDSNRHDEKQNVHVLSRKGWKPLKNCYSRPQSQSFRNQAVFSKLSCI